MSECSLVSPQTGYKGVRTIATHPDPYICSTVLVECNIDGAQKGWPVGVGAGYCPHPVPGLSAIYAYIINII